MKSIVRGRTTARSAVARRRRLRDKLAAEAGAQLRVNVGADEIEAHFQGMPEPYWRQVSESDLAWHLGTIHTFFEKHANPEGRVQPFAIDWRDDHHRNLTKVTACMWDSHGLLAKIAAAFSAMRIDIVRAIAFARADRVALGVFEISEPDGRHTVDPKRLHEMAFLIDGALSHPPHFASVWAATFHKTMTFPVQSAPAISIDNRRSRNHTILRIKAADRLGLLSDILKAVSESDLYIGLANIRSGRGTIHDAFWLTDLNGRKLIKPDQLARLRSTMKRAILSEPTPSDAESG